MLAKSKGYNPSVGKKQYKRAYSWRRSLY